MRLIDADKLNIDELCRLRSDLKSGLHVGSTLRTQRQMNNFIKALDDIIDNAPTVEAIPTELHEKIMDKVEGELLECQSNLRPQGEWKLDDTEQFCYCDQCEDTYYPRPLDPSWNYCPNCGADMRGKEE